MKPFINIQNQTEVVTLVYVSCEDGGRLEPECWIVGIAYIYGCDQCICITSQF